MSVLGMVAGVYRGGEVHVDMKDPDRSSHRQKMFWEVARRFGAELLKQGTKRGLGLSGLPVWSCQLMVGLVGQQWCYWLFCNWPGLPRFWTLDLQPPEPETIDQLLAGLKMDLAEPIHAFRLALPLVDGTEGISDDMIQLVAREYLDYLQGVHRRKGDEPSRYELLMAVTGESKPRQPPAPDSATPAGWRVRLKPLRDGEELLLEALQTPTLRASKEGGHLYLRSEAFAQYADSFDVFNHANQLVRTATGLLHLWGIPSFTMEAESAEMVNEDGAIDGLMTSARMGASVLSKGGRQALFHRMSAASDRRFIDYLLPAAVNDLAIRRALNILATPDCDWADLYTALEIVSHDVGGTTIITNRGWASAAEIERFERTANTAEYGRHAKPFAPPKRPMTIVEARETVSRILRGWIANKVSSSRP